LALIALILPSIILLAGRLELYTVKWIMLAATVVWFVAATPWMWKDNGDEQQETG
jgi:nitrate/nitrite transporter NarK